MDQLPPSGCSSREGQWLLHRAPTVAPCWGHHSAKATLCLFLHPTSRWPPVGLSASVGPGAALASCAQVKSHKATCVWQVSFSVLCSWRAALRAKEEPPTHTADQRRGPGRASSCDVAAGSRSLVQASTPHSLWVTPTKSSSHGDRQLHLLNVQNMCKRSRNYSIIVSCVSFQKLYTHIEPGVLTTMYSIGIQLRPPFRCSPLRLSGALTWICLSNNC